MARKVPVRLKLQRHMNNATLTGPNIQTFRGAVGDKHESVVGAGAERGQLFACCLQVSHTTRDERFNKIQNSMRHFASYTENLGCRVN